MTDMITALLLTLSLTAASVPPTEPAAVELPPLAELFEEPIATATCTYPLTGNACQVTCSSGAVLTCGTNFPGACNVCPGVLLTCNRTIYFCFDT
jgi:hypothetical protein